MTKTKKQFIALVAALVLAAVLIGTYFIISGIQQRKADAEAVLLKNKAVEEELNK